ncbi:MAG: hypothetical protein SGARI_006486 [Bacillariaceae sp.]
MSRVLEYLKRSVLRAKIEIDGVDVVTRFCGLEDDPKALFKTRVTESKKHFVPLGTGVHGELLTYVAERILKGESRPTRPAILQYVMRHVDGYRLLERIQMLLEGDVLESIVCAMRMCHALKVELEAKIATKVDHSEIHQALANMQREAL